MKVVTRSRYLGGFISDQVAKVTCLKLEVDGWAVSVQTLSGVDFRHLQKSYAVLQKSLQQEWAFVQRFTPNTGDTFGSVEGALQDSFLQAFFQDIG